MCGNSFTKNLSLFKIWTSASGGSTDPDLELAKRGGARGRIVGGFNLLALLALLCHLIFFTQKEEGGGGGRATGPHP